MTAFDDELKTMMEGEFSEEMTLETPSVDIETRGIFDLTFEMIDPDTGATIMSDHPRASIFSKEVLAVISEIDEGSILVVRGKRYRVKTPVHDDGAGIIIMELKNA